MTPAFYNSSRKYVVQSNTLTLIFDRWIGHPTWSVQTFGRDIYNAGVLTPGFDLTVNKQQKQKDFDTEKYHYLS